MGVEAGSTIVERRQSESNELVEVGRTGDVSRERDPPVVAIGTERMGLARLSEVPAAREGCETSNWLDGAKKGYLQADPSY